MLQRQYPKHSKTTSRLVSGRAVAPSTKGDAFSIVVFDSYCMCLHSCLTCLILLCNEREGPAIIYNTFRHLICTASFQTTGGLEEKVAAVESCSLDQFDNGSH